MSPEQRLIRTMVQSFAEIIERQVLRFENQGAEYERKLAEHRASFAARTGADEKIIEGMRSQVQDMRAEMERLRAQMSEPEVSVVGIINERNETWERFWAEVARLKSQTPKHPVKVGEWVKRLTPSPMTPAGGVAKVTDVFEVHGLAVKIERPDGIKGTWWAKCCEPCDPPAADHDTDAGKASALKTEPVAEEIKVGDVVEVVSHTGRNTWLADVGSVGTVVTVEEINDSISVHLEHVPGKKNALAGYVSFCDVRKVTT